MTPQQINTLQRIGQAILETIADAGVLGAPSGPMYAALVAHGLTLDQYQQIMGQLERKAFVACQSYCYTITPAGEAFLAKLKQVAT